ncbi:hypothetical protein [Amycolatopsis sp. CA-230715]|uniref:hypothetical protein n=1 Tax=Amycolatopsis sp. CA-230715 TaxID=2745196 RepID=UPI001C021567|nr:hypothetical protein [Amycolatopsis sp. CA-230715]
MDRASAEQGDSLSHARKAVLSIPLMVLVPIVFGVGAVLWSVPPVWPAFGFGALGWLVALVARSPIGAVVGKPAAGQAPSARAKTIIVAASGPVEEITRLVLVLLLATDFSGAFWAGLGWATVEILFTCVNSAVIAALVSRGDERAQEIQEVLSGQGLAGDRTGLYCVLERISATLLHIGFTWILAWSPLMVVATIVVHSAVNLAAVRLVPRSLARTEAVLAAAGAVVFCAGLAAMH